MPAGLVGSFPAERLRIDPDAAEIVEDDREAGPAEGRGVIVRAGAEEGSGQG